MYPLRDDPKLYPIWKSASPALKRRLYLEWSEPKDTKPSAIQLLDQENKLLWQLIDNYRSELQYTKNTILLQDKLDISVAAARKGRDNPRKPRKSLPAGQVLPASGVCIQVP